MGVGNLSGISFELFITGVVFILMIGCFLSLGVLRMFQLRRRQGSLFLALSVLSLIGLIVSVNTWFA